FAAAAESIRASATTSWRTASARGFAGAADRSWTSKGNQGTGKRRTEMKSRMQDKYRKETTPALMKHFGLRNIMAVPKLSKITVNIGLGEASQNVKLLD